MSTAFLVVQCAQCQRSNEIEIPMGGDRVFAVECCACASFSQVTLDTRGHPLLVAEGVDEGASEGSAGGGVQPCSVPPKKRRKSALLAISPRAETADSKPLHAKRGGVGSPNELSRACPAATTAAAASPTSEGGEGERGGAVLAQQPSPVATGLGKGGGEKNQKGVVKQQQATGKEQRASGKEASGKAGGKDHRAAKDASGTLKGKEQARIRDESAKAKGREQRVKDEKEQPQLNSAAQDQSEGNQRKPSLRRGSAVIARFHDGYFYSAIVEQMQASSFLVAWEDGDPSSWVSWPSDMLVVRAPALLSFCVAVLPKPLTRYPHLTPLAPSH